MLIKKEYNIGDPVWIHGIGPSNKLTQGKVIANIDLSTEGYTDLHYIIAIPTHIEPLLEIRTWHTMSQDEKGPIGSLRELGEDLDKEHKKIQQLGFYAKNPDDDNDPTPEQIMAALEKSTNNLTHKPLNLKDTNNNKKRKYYPRKKKQ